MVCTCEGEHMHAKQGATSLDAELKHRVTDKAGRISGSSYKTQQC